VRFYALAVSETSVAVPAPYPRLVRCLAERPPPSPTFSPIFAGVFSAFLLTVAEASEPPTADVWWRRTAHRFLKFSAPLGPSAWDPSGANIDQYALGPPRRILGPPYRLGGNRARWAPHTYPHRPAGSSPRMAAPRRFDCPSGNTGGNDPALPPRGAEIVKDGRMPLRHFT